MDSHWQAYVPQPGATLSVYGEGPIGRLLGWGQRVLRMGEGRTFARHTAGALWPDLMFAAVIPRAKYQYWPALRDAYAAAGAACIAMEPAEPIAPEAFRAMRRMADVLEGLPYGWGENVLQALDHLTMKITGRPCTLFRQCNDTLPRNNCSHAWAKILVAGGLAPQSLGIASPDDILDWQLDSPAWRLAAHSPNLPPWALAKLRGRPA